jgi:hypothetical protein
VGVLTDLILATPAQAEEIGKTHPEHSYAATDMKGFDQIKAATLWCLLVGDDLNDVNHVVSVSERFQLLYEGSEDGPWVHLFPTEFTQLIAKLERERLSEIASRWAHTEELQRYYTIDDVKYYLETLFNFALSAEANGKSILMWICL